MDTAIVSVIGVELTLVLYIPVRFETTQKVVPSSPYESLVANANSSSSLRAPSIMTRFSIDDRTESRIPLVVLLSQITYAGYTDTASGHQSTFNYPGESMYWMVTFIHTYRETRDFETIQKMSSGHTARHLFKFVACTQHGDEISLGDYAELVESGSFAYSYELHRGRQEFEEGSDSTSDLNVDAPIDGSSVRADAVEAKVDSGVRCRRRDVQSAYDHMVEKMGQMSEDVEKMSKLIDAALQAMLQKRSQN
ncbi:hypothetical protein FISHEDRAFT_58873 [Fistulina hepatica ATCC 64428]|uniref:Uncharacterized protein n=1 Tax=Fistulina hepatica ATCC 64428 TaxID=1128425 RepID=A0A0D7AC67_9AGAR|nr:hypothetical protein FISHEDRAFT_58873 [Fistulina hepatica ATCC 64428]